MGAKKAGTIVLGHHPEYLLEAKRRNARCFDMHMDEWDRMTEAERWEANRQFLDEAIANGDEIVLATRLHLLKPGSYFEKELEYLANKGYQPSTDQSRLVKENP
jgi:filamentous hemagglutinin